MTEIACETETDYPQDLDLSHNQISGIEESIAARLLNIENVRLDNNPLICDKCHLGPLIGKVRMVSGGERHSSLGEKDEFLVIESESMSFPV